MALGKPVIAPRTPGNLDFATGGKQLSGRLPPERDHEQRTTSSTRDASETYRTGRCGPSLTWPGGPVDAAPRRDPDLRNRLGDAGRATIREHYSAGPVMAVVADRLSEIAGRRR